MNHQIITVNINGPVGSGKSAILASVRDLLINAGYCVALIDPAERLNPSRPIDSALPHEKPDPSRAIIVLTERVEPPKG